MQHDSTLCGNRDWCGGDVRRLYRLYPVGGDANGKGVAVSLRGLTEWASELIRAVLPSVRKFERVGYIEIQIRIFGVKLATIRIHAVEGPIPVEEKEMENERD